MKTRIHFWAYHSEFFLEWEHFQAEVVEEMKTHLFSVAFFV